jgi:protein TonB
MQASATEAQPDERSAERSEGRRNTALMVMVVIAILALVGFALKSMLGGHGTAAKKPPKISLLPTTPPPPPPPPKEEKKPEPPKEQKEVKMDQAEKKNEPPADPALKMEGAAGDGPSAFAAGKVTSEDLSRIGAGGSGVAANVGGLVNPFNNYAAAIKAELQRYLGRRSELKRRQYRIEVRVWVGDDGRMKNFELLGTTNDGDTDEAIRNVLAALPAFSDPPPAKMPQPIRLRIVASGRA